MQRINILFDVQMLYDLEFNFRNKNRHRAREELQQRALLTMFSMVYRCACVSTAV